jgi:proline iminopeptidase
MDKKDTNRAMTTLYSEIEPFASGHLETFDGQKLYWEQIGDHEGTPAVYLHGGPGSGCSPSARRYFEPSSYRAVLFDQRGCGRSSPSAYESSSNLTLNNTERLIADIELLRKHLNINQWVVVGVSWGVSLGLAYAQRHPESVTAMVLGAVTTGTHREIDWITRDMGRIFPREWECFTKLVPEVRNVGDICAAYAKLLSSDDPKIHEQAALEWCKWEDTHVSLMPGWEPNPRYKDARFRLIFSRIVTHYWSHGCFFDDNELIEGMNCIKHIPSILIHGRWDVSSPLDVAWNLHNSWPNSEIQIIDKAGHGGIGFSESMTESLIKLSETL